MNNQDPMSVVAVEVPQEENAPSNNFERVGAAASFLGGFVATGLAVVIAAVEKQCGNDLVPEKVVVGSFIGGIAFMAGGFMALTHKSKPQA